MTYQRNDTPEPLADHRAAMIASALQNRAQDLADAAVYHGLVLTIHLQPRKPLAMRNYQHVVTVRKAFTR